MSGVERVIDRTGRRYFADVRHDTRLDVPEVRVYSNRDRHPSNFAPLIYIDPYEPGNPAALRAMADRLHHAADVVEGFQAERVAESHVCDSPSPAHAPTPVGGSASLSEPGNGTDGPGHSTTTDVTGPAVTAPAGPGATNHLETGEPR